MFYDGPHGGCQRSALHGAGKFNYSIPDAQNPESLDGAKREAHLAPQFVVAPREQAPEGAAMESAEVVAYALG